MLSPLKDSEKRESEFEDQKERKNFSNQSIRRLANHEPVTYTS